MLTALAIGSCKEVSTSTVELGEGALELKLNPTSKIESVEETKSVESNITLSDFSIDVVNSEGVSYVSYASYDDLPAELALPEGSYTVKAENGKMYSAGFDAPYFYGSQNVEIKTGATSKVDLVCAIANVKVTVDYSEELLNTLENIVVTVNSKYDASDDAKIGILKFSNEDTDQWSAGWFAPPYDSKLEVYVTAINKLTGEGVTSSSTIQGVKARQWRKITVDIRTSGTLEFDITIDDTLEEQDDVDIEVPDNNDILDNNGDNGNWDDPEGPEPPTPAVKNPEVTGAALGTTDNNAPFTVDEVIYFNCSDEATKFNVLDVLIKSEAEAGLTNLKLLIESEVLADLLPAIGVNGEIDLANPGAEDSWCGLFGELGLLDPEDPIKGKTEYLFSVGGLMEMLWGVITSSETPDLEAVHKFHLTAVDANGETKKTLSIVLQ